MKILLILNLFALTGHVFSAEDEDLFFEREIYNSVSGFFRVCSTHVGDNARRAFKGYKSKLNSAYNQCEMIGGRFNESDYHSGAKEITGGMADGYCTISFSSTVICHKNLR